MPATRWLSQRRAWVRTAMLVGGFVSLGIVLYVLVYRQWDVIAAYDWHLHWGAMLASLVLFGVNLMLAAWVWARIMNAVGGQIELSRHIRYYCLSNIGKRLPGTLWYLAGRGYLYRRIGVSLRLVSMASGIEVVVALISGILVSLLFAFPMMRTLPRPYLLVLAGIVVLGIAMSHPRTVGWLLSRLGISPQDARGLNYTRLLEWFVSYTLIWIIGGAVLYTVANAITTINIQHLPYIVGSWSLVGVIVSISAFFSPSNIGLTEIGLSLLLANIMPSSVAVLVVLFSRLLLLLYEMMWAAVYLGVSWLADASGELR